MERGGGGSGGAGRRWSESEIEARIEEAVDTLKRVPVPDIQRSVTMWPEFVHDAHEAYGYGEFRPPRRPAAPDAISRLDETLNWLRWLPRPAQRILWSRANGFSWRRIAYFVGKAPNTCIPWQIVALVEAPALGALFGLVLHTRKLIADQRVALADYKTRAAERYVPFAVQDAFEKEVMRRLERIEDKLDTQAEHFATALAVTGLA